VGMMNVWAPDLEYLQKDNKPRVHLLNIEIQYIERLNVEQINVEILNVERPNIEKYLT
jgi:hypothetical protein